jgi:NADH-quinone oxidoreductase subunit E
VSPLLPKGGEHWRDDPGHIHDAPTPPPMPDDQGESVGITPPASEPGIPGGEAEEMPADGEARSQPAPVPDPSEVKVPKALEQEIRRAMKRYPRRRSAAIPALWAVQRRYGWCTPEGIRQAAAVMEVTPGYLQSVASFYDLFRLEPQGDHQVLVCTNISCWLRGADGLLTAFKEATDGHRVARADVPKPGGSAGEAEQPPDDVFIRGFECLGACDIAPMASIDERYYGPLEESDAADAIEQLRSGEEVLPTKRLENRGAAGGKRSAADERVTKHPVNKPTRRRPKSASRGPAASARKAAGKSSRTSPKGKR